MGKSASRYYSPHTPNSLILLAFLLIFTTACINGPIRYKTLGFRKYVTIELAREQKPILKPLAVLGVPVDIVVCALDTVAIPVMLLPWVATHPGPDGTPISQTWKSCSPWQDKAEMAFVLSLWIIVEYPIVYPIGVTIYPYLPKDAYEDWIGKETGIYATRDVKRAFQ